MRSGIIAQFRLTHFPRPISPPAFPPAISPRPISPHFPRPITNGFSKKLENHRAAVALHFGFYNFCQLHGTLRVTPAMEAGVTDHVWDVAELLAF